MAKSKRILVLTHPNYRPDRAGKRDGTERDVWRALKRMGHTVHSAGVNRDLATLEHEVAEFEPDIVFNLMEEFMNEAVYDFHIVSYLESREIPYTGCNPRGLILSRNKFLVGGIAESLGVRVPRGFLFGPGLKVPRAIPPFPLFLKLNREHASLGIRKSNRVTNSRQLAAVRTRLKRDFGREILVQEFISGADVSVSVWGNNGKAEVMPPRTLPTRDPDRISTARLKFSASYQRLHSVKSFPFKGPAVALVREQALLLFRHLDLSGYARFDFRVDGEGEPVLIDVNANPNLSRIEDFARSAHSCGWTYYEIIQNILDLGFKYHPNV